jgi:hypothetical protein
LKQAQLEKEIIALRSDFSQADEKHTIAEIGLQAHIDDNNKLMRDIDDKLRADIGATNKLINESEARNSNNFTALKDLIKSELLIVSGDMDIKLSGVGGLLREQVELIKTTMELNEAEVNAAILRTEESLHSTKSDIERRLVVVTETTKEEIEAGIHTLKSEFHDAYANAQRQIDENKHAAEVANAKLSISAEESKQICSAVRMETTERLTAIGIVFREEQANTLSTLTQQLDIVRSSLHHHELESRAAFEDHASRLTAASQKSENMLRAAQEENSKDIASLGEIFGNELACTIREVELKLSTSHEQLKLQIDNSQSSLETAKSEFAAAIQRTDDKVEKVTAHMFQEIQGLGAEIRLEHSEAIAAANTLIAVTRGELLTQIGENSGLIQRYSAEFAASHQILKETLETLEARSSQDLLNLARDIRNEKDTEFLHVNEKISAYRYETDGQSMELRSSVEKVILEIAAASEKTEAIINSVRTDSLNEISAVRAAIAEEVAAVSENAEKNIVKISERCEAQINSSKSQLEINIAELQLAVQGAITQFENAKSDFVKESAVLGAEVKDDIMSGFFKLDEKITSVVKEQYSTLQQIEETMNISFAELRLQDLSFKKSLEENVEQINGVHQTFQVLLNTAQEVTAQGIGRLEGKIQSNASDQEKIKQQIQSVFSELQLQIDAAREAVDNGVAELATSQTAVSALIEALKGEISSEHCILIQQVKQAQESELRNVKETVTTTCSDLRTISELHGKEIIRINESAEKGMQALQAHLEEITNSNGQQLEQLGKIYEEQVMLARQELQSQIDLCLLAHHETMESMKKGFPVAQSIESKLLDTVRSEWKADVSNSSEEATLANAALKVELVFEFNQKLVALEERLEAGKVEVQRLHSEASAQVNLQISDTTATLKNAMTSFDGRIDAVSKRTSQIEESVLKGAQSAAEYRQEVAQNFASMTKHLSEVQGQHAFCLTDIMQDKQEIGELQLAIGQIRSEVAELVKKCADYLQVHTDMKLEMRKIRESGVPGALFSSPSTFSKTHEETQENLTYSIPNQERRSCGLDDINTVEADMLQRRELYEVSWQEHRENLEAVNLILNRLKADHDVLQKEVSNSAVQFLQLAKDLAALKITVSEVQEQQAFGLTNIMQDRQELCEAQLVLRKVQTEIDQLMKMFSQVMQDNGDKIQNVFQKRKVEMVCISGPEVDQDSNDIALPTAYLDCFEKIDIIASILCSRVQVLLSELSSFSCMQHQQSVTAPSVNQTLAQDVERISRNLADVQQQLCSGLSEMISERQEQFDIRLSVRELSRLIKDIQKRMDDFTHDQGPRTTKLELATNQNIEESPSVMISCIDDLHARLKPFIASELATLRNEMIESSKMHKDPDHGSWVITKLNQTGAGLSVEPKLGEGDSIVDLLATQEHGTLPEVAGEKGER